MIKFSYVLICKTIAKPFHVFCAMILLNVTIYAHRDTYFKYNIRRFLTSKFNKVYGEARKSRILF